MSKRKICCFCQYWASGGIESFLCNLLEPMDHSKLEVDIVSAKLEKSDFTARLEARGVRFIQLSGSLNDMSRNCRMFRGLLRRRRYDVVHLHLYQGVSMAYCRIARQEGVPVRIIHSHNEALRRSFLKPVKLLLHRWGRRCFTSDATALWACSKAAADFLFGPHKAVTLIPNGIDTNRFRFNDDIRQTMRKELGLADCLVLGTVGRLCSQKNQIFLLEVFVRLIQLRPDSRLLLVGDGKDREMLERRAAQLGIQAQTIFYGRSDEVERMLWAMDVFALPSLFEGLSVAAVEAQAAGLPVLCSSGLSREVKLTEKTEFMSLETGPKAWADKIMKISYCKTDRERYADAVSAAGFEAYAVAQSISETYLGRNDGTANNFSYRPNL